MSGTSTTPVGRSLRGRPAATSHAEIERIAFRLFGERGFEATTLDDIAEAVGVGRRTVTRYYRSKNDIPWGQFDDTLASFRNVLAEMPRDRPLWQCVQDGVMAFNRFPRVALEQHRQRMRLILGTPALEAHSMIRYAEWRGVIAEFVADRLGSQPQDLLPQTIGHVCLGLAVSAYQAWLAVEDTDIDEHLLEAMRGLRIFLAQT